MDGAECLDKQSEQNGVNINCCSVWVLRLIYPIDTFLQEVLTASTGAFSSSSQHSQHNSQLNFLQNSSFAEMTRHHQQLLHQLSFLHNNLHVSILVFTLLV